MCVRVCVGGGGSCVWHDLNGNEVLPFIFGTEKGCIFLLGITINAQHNHNIHVIKSWQIYFKIVLHLLFCCSQSHSLICYLVTDHLIYLVVQVFHNIMLNQRKDHELFMNSSWTSNVQFMKPEKCDRKSRKLKIHKLFMNHSRTEHEHRIAHFTNMTQHTSTIISPSSLTVIHQ